MISRYNRAICALILSLFLTGCWDYRDVNKRTIGITMGVDDLNDDVEYVGEKAKLWSGSSTEGSMAQIETYKYTASGINFEKGRADNDNKLPSPDFPGATRVVVFSKKYAEKRSILPYINRLYYLIGLRSSVPVVISERKLDELFSSKIDNDICIGYGIENTISYLNDYGITMQKTVQEIQSDIRFANIGYLLPYVTVQDDTIKYLGLAVMKDSKLVGIIKREDSSGFLLVLSKKSGDIRVVPNPSNEKNLLSIKSTLGKRSIKTSYEDKKIHIYIDLKLKSQLQYEYKIEALSKQDIKKVEEIISNKLKENILSAAKRSQDEFKSDVFGFARHFKAANPRVYKYIDWNKEYPNAIFHVNVDTTIVNTTLLDPNAKKAN
jgi:spore germination protein KC